MELGLTSFAETHTDPVSGETLSHGERLRNVVEEIVKAEEVGLDVYGLGEHHRIDMAASAPAITLAAAAARTERIRLSSAVIVLSSADPVRTFQDFATLDLISNGRAELMAAVARSSSPFHSSATRSATTTNCLPRSWSCCCRSATTRGSPGKDASGHHWRINLSIRGRSRTRYRYGSP